MEKLIYDSSNGLWYELQGDYYIPRLSIPETQPVSRWGRMHLRYLQEHRTGLYTVLLTTDKLNNYLMDIDQQAVEKFNRLIKQIAESRGIDEQLKEHNQMKWVKEMNNILHVAQEIVENELIFLNKIYACLFIISSPLRFLK